MDDPEVLYKSFEQFRLDVPKDKVTEAVNIALSQVYLNFRSRYYAKIQEIATHSNLAPGLKTKDSQNNVVWFSSIKEERISYNNLFWTIYQPTFVKISNLYRDGMLGLDAIVTQKGKTSMTPLLLMEKLKGILDIESKVNLMDTKSLLYRNMNHVRSVNETKILRIHKIYSKSLDPFFKMLRISKKSSSK